MNDFCLSSGRCQEQMDANQGSKVGGSNGDNKQGKGDWHGFRHDDWVISTRYGHHICHDIHMLMNVRSIQEVTVSLITGDTHTASVMGEVDLHGALILQNVLYIPEFRVNVVSVFALPGELMVQFGSGKTLIQEAKSKKTICIGELFQGLCVIGK